MILSHSYDHRIINGAMGGLFIKELKQRNRELGQSHNNYNMQLQLKRPICFFDLETTGVNIAKDRIVEISILKAFPDGSETRKDLAWSIQKCLSQQRQQQCMASQTKR